MARQLDQIPVIDMESTCWQGKAPIGQVGEIIKIGVCPVDVATLQRLEKRSIPVKPEQSEISAFCTELCTHYCT
jgi:inhibitor of KinA sporulation pathway (predicted exonuclease)